MIVRTTPKYGSNFLSYSNGVEYFENERMYVLSRFTGTSSLSIYDMNGVLESSTGAIGISSICTDGTYAYLRTGGPAISKYNQNGMIVDQIIATGGGPIDPAIIYDDGYIYSSGNEGNTLAKYDLDLNMIWSVNIDTPAYVLTSDSTSVYAGTGNDTVYKISKSGSISWSVSTSSIFNFIYTLSVSSTGTVYVGGLPRASAPYNNWSIISSSGSIINSGYLSYTFSSPVSAPHATQSGIFTMTHDSSDNLYIASGRLTVNATDAQPLIKCNSSMSIIGTESNPTTLTSKWSNSTTKSIFIYNNNIYALSNLSLSSVEPGVRVYSSNLNYVNQFSLPSEQAAIVF
jgi:hypothetical protein